MSQDDRYEEKTRLMLDNMVGHDCEVCGESGDDMIIFDGVWFHEDCAKECDIYECDECGAFIEWDHLKVCPICGAEKGGLNV